MWLVLLLSLIHISEDDQSVTYYVTDATAWWKEMNQLKEENVRDLSLIHI